MEWIKYHEAEKVFDLRTEHSTYQMQVREYDTLVHLYYGSPVGDALITDRIVCVDRGFSGNPYEAEKDKTFSLDTLPQEYTAYGNGDYRINGLETEQADGSDTANVLSGTSESAFTVPDTGAQSSIFSTSGFVLFCGVFSASFDSVFFSSCSGSASSNPKINVRTKDATNDTTIIIIP